MSAKATAARKRTPFEIGVLAAAAIAILAVVAGLAAGGLNVGTSRPDLRVAAEYAGGGSSGGSTYIVTVRNEGGTTAAGVVVEVTVGDETREAQLNLVTRGDESRATVVFPPGTQGAAEAQIISFSQPGG